MGVKKHDYCIDVQFTSSLIVGRTGSSCSIGLVKQSLAEVVVDVVNAD